MKFRVAFSPILLLGIAACAPKSETGAPAAPQEATFSATEFAFSGPDSIAPGFTTIHFQNQGKQEHHMILGRLDEGKTLQDVVAFAKEHPTAEPPFIQWYGSANGVEGGGSTGSTVDLPAGHYVIFCFLPDPTDGTPHMLKGMMRELNVAGPVHPAKAPESHGEIRLKDFAFTLPPLSAGTHTFHVINDGPQTHEIQLIRLNEGATAKDYLAALAPGGKGPPPGTMAGGPGAFSAGRDGYWTVTLTPGQYIVLCFVPDKATGAPHAMMGMVQDVTIAAN